MLILTWLLKLHFLLELNHYINLKLYLDPLLLIICFTFFQIVHYIIFTPNNFAKIYKIIYIFVFIFKGKNIIRI